MFSFSLDFGTFENSLATKTIRSCENLICFYIFQRFTPTWFIPFGLASISIKIDAKFIILYLVFHQCLSQRDLDHLSPRCFDNAQHCGHFIACEDTVESIKLSKGFVTVLHCARSYFSISLIFTANVARVEFNLQSLTLIRLVVCSFDFTFLRISGVCSLFTWAPPERRNYKYEIKSGVYCRIFAGRDCENENEAYGWGTKLWLDCGVRQAATRL